MKTSRLDSNLNEFAKISIKEKLSYCFGDLGLTMVYTLSISLIIYFYTNVAGINAGVVGVIFLVSRLLDGASDLAMGVIIDRTVSKYGKARIWILRMLIPYLITPVLLMLVPDVGSAGKIIYVFITYNLMNTVVYTVISQPYHALGSRLTRDKAERDTTSNIRMGFSITASMLITAFMLPFIN
jgi:GPH family glycoside/pentoside/hexuronide:cation symporter